VDFLGAIFSSLDFSSFDLGSLTCGEVDFGVALALVPFQAEF